MADAAPSGGGGSIWGPLEIIIVIILIIGLLSKLRGTDPSLLPKVDDKNLKTTEIVVPKPEEKCGVTILKPKPLEAISTSVALSGSVSGCSWEPKDGTALFVQVVDGHGIPVSDYIAVPVASEFGNISTFSTTIPIHGIPIRGTGYVILVPANYYTASSEGKITSQVPIRFN